jgi:xanthine dehydrogenase accessory factor
MDATLTTAIAWLNAGEPVATATVVATGGSAPRPRGAILAATADGRFAGSVSGGCVENDVLAHVEQVLGSGEPRLVQYGISDEAAFAVGLACGGTIEVFVEPARFLSETAGLLDRNRPGAIATIVAGPGIDTKAVIDFHEGIAAGALPAGIAADVVADASELVTAERSMKVAYGDTTVFIQAIPLRPRLVVFGAVHIAQELSRMAADLGYDVTVSDHRPAFTTETRFPHAGRVIAAPTAEAVETIGFDPSTFVAVLSHDYRAEEPVLMAALEAGCRYIGVLGSTRTHARRVEGLHRAGVGDDAISRLHAPIGLDIGAVEPGEIALSILAEMTAVRYRAGAAPELRGTALPRPA